MKKIRRFYRLRARKNSITKSLSSAIKYEDAVKKANDFLKKDKYEYIQIERVEIVKWLRKPLNKKTDTKEGNNE
ncbi:hypothetical protein [Mycoplasma tauri]|uniref:hypothetical protein n=1 Tax=Mycoplasma tauri TaxID=547987 RepID=UPI001CBC0FF2|nr:hypothetical protein [Mycoplasma tauri]MBZ4226999.1 hypothetical protein [Mycoplasma tauri]